SSCLQAEPREMRHYMALSLSVAAPARLCGLTRDLGASLRAQPLGPDAAADQAALPSELSGLGLDRGRIRHQPFLVEDARGGAAPVAYAHAICCLGPTPLPFADRAGAVDESALCHGPHGSAMLEGN